MLVEHLIWQLVVYVDLTFLIIHMQVITIGQVLALNFLQKILAVLYGPVYRGQFMVPIQFKIICRLDSYKALR
jgi:hypothetical protein